MAKFFLQVKQSTILRWEYLNNDYDIYGLYADRFYDATMILLRNKKYRRIALLHADSSVTFEDLQYELKWIGHDCEKIIYIKDVPLAHDHLNDLFANDKLREQFEIRLIKSQYNKIKPIADTNMSLLTDNSSASEFDADMIFLTKDKILTSKQSIDGYTLLSNDMCIFSIYSSFQESLLPRKGSRCPATAPLKQEDTAKVLEERTNNENTKAYWVYTTTNKNAQAANLISNSFQGTMEDKFPKIGINCFSSKTIAEGKLQNFFKASPVKYGGPRKGFIFEFNMTATEFVTCFYTRMSKKMDMKQQKFDAPTGFTEYTYDREKDQLIHGLIPNQEIEASSEVISNLNPL